ncbi:hypothetical protein R1flu_006286 [Riccia fluitans]|uniref:Uncharacterized protein n=1 Tax=Riccia fluitans TaxID=41844 RepID=A0ABD1YZM8_9MARC
MQVQLDKACMQKVETEAEMARLMLKTNALALETVLRPCIVLPMELRMKTLILDMNRVLLRISRTSNDFVVAHKWFGYIVLPTSPW